MTNFKADIKYNKENTEHLCETVRKRFHFWDDTSLYLLAAALIGLGLYKGLDGKLGLILVLCGCLLLPNANYAKKQFTKRMLSFMEGWWPTVSYRFSEDVIESVTDRETTKTRIDKIICLLKEEEYYFLFDSRSSAFMIRRASLSPKDEEAFEAFLTEKTGLKWKKPSKRRIRFI